MEVDLINKTSARQHLGFRSSGYTTTLLANPILPLALSDLNYSYVQDPMRSQQLTLKAEGSATMGLAIQLKANVISKKLLHASIGAEYDRKASANLQFNLYDSEHPISGIYDVIKNSVVKVEDYVKIKGEIGISPLDVLTLKGSFKIPVKTWGDYYMVPHFTKPELPPYNNSPWNFSKPLSLYSEVSKDIILGCKPGLRIEDHEGRYVKQYTSTDEYQYEAAWANTPLEIDISDLTPNETYRCYPTFSMLGLNPFVVTPYNEFTVPEPMEIDLGTPSNTVTLKKGQDLYAAINGGWGEYSVTSINKDVCSAELRKDGNNFFVVITGKSKGASTVTVNDLRANVSKTVMVTVTEEDSTAPIISVSPSKIDFGQVAVGSSKTETFTVSNVGTSNLTFSVSETHSEFDIPDSGKEFTLSPNTSKTISVTYTPSRPNGGAGSLVRIFSDAENGTQIVELSGQSAEATTEPTKIVMTTDKEVGEELCFEIGFSEGVHMSYWLDLNNNGIQDDGDIWDWREREYSSAALIETHVQSKTFAIYLKNASSIASDFNHLTDIDFSNFNDNGYEVKLEELVFIEDNIATLRLPQVSNVKTVQLRTHASSSFTAIGESIELFNCYDNNLTSLDVSQCPNLLILYCGKNKLSYLNVSNCTSITNLYCPDNKLASLDITNNQKLQEFECHNNNLTSLSMGYTPNLSLLACRDNPQLTSLNISQLPNLETFNCVNCHLRTLNTRQNPKLATLLCDGNYLESLDLSKNQKLACIGIDNNKMDEDALNSIYRQIPDISSQDENNEIYWPMMFKMLRADGNPGYSDSDKSIAEDKGWEFEDKWVMYYETPQRKAKATDSPKHSYVSGSSKSELHQINL